MFLTFFEELRRQRLPVTPREYLDLLAAMDAGDFTTALEKFESAYNDYIGVEIAREIPMLHVFNFNIAQAAYELGDCVKAQKAYQRFLDLVNAARPHWRE